MIYSLPFARYSLRYRGLTLIELLLVIGIIAVLAGIIWVILAPAREKAREIHCISNMRQIHLALEAYRQDYDGVDVEIAQGFADLGLPPRISGFTGEWPFMREEWLVGSPEIWWCPQGQRYYGYAVTFNDSPTKRRLEATFRKRRGEYPIVFDRYHNPPMRVLAQEALRGKEVSLKVIVLRLSGKVEVKYLGIDKKFGFPPSDQW